MPGNAQFGTLAGSSADFPSAPSAGASFSVGPRVGSDNYVPKGSDQLTRTSAKLRTARGGSCPEKRAEATRHERFSDLGRAPGPRAHRGRGRQCGPMPALQRGETTIGPLALGGRTITLVARTTAVHLGNDERGALHIRS